MKHTQKKKDKCHSSNSDGNNSSSSWSDGYSSSGNVCKKHNCSQQKFDTYPSPIKTTKPINSKFSILNNTCLNDPAKDIGNLSANHTQSEITAKLLDPKMLGVFLKNVKTPFDK
jgi:hypothetical protein